MMKASPFARRHSSRTRCSTLSLSAALLAFACSEADSAAEAGAPVESGSAESGVTPSIDILPNVYPNRLESGATQIDVALSLPGDIERDALGPWSARASAGLELDGPSVAAIAPVSWRDTDADGRAEAVATFDVAELRAAGLVGRETTRLSVSFDAGGATVAAGSDRLFDTSAWLLTLPEPSGPSSVGTTSWQFEDASRPGSGAHGRRIAVRVWYPAQATRAEPADYFLDVREASQNAIDNALPANIFDRLHGASRLDAPVDASERHPVLLMSTGWSSPIALYSGIAQELASHGYVVVGLAHADGSGVVVYPDGTDSGFAPDTPSSDAAVEAWALDVGFVARWLDASLEPSSLEGLPAIATRADLARDVLATLDLERVGAVGHSLGGAAVVRAAVEVPAIRASANIDGSFRGPITSSGPTTPVFVMLYDGHVAVDPSPIAFHEQASRGPVYEATVLGSGHNDFTDFGVLVHQLSSFDPSVVLSDFLVGPLGTDRALAIESAYLRAFFGAELGGTASPLLSSPAPEYPEVTFGAYPASH